MFFRKKQSKYTFNVQIYGEALARVSVFAPDRKHAKRYAHDYIILNECPDNYASRLPEFNLLRYRDLMNS